MRCVRIRAWNSFKGSKRTQTEQERIAGLEKSRLNLGLSELIMLLVVHIVEPNLILHDAVNISSNYGCTHLTLMHGISVALRLRIKFYFTQN